MKKYWVGQKVHLGVSIPYHFMEILWQTFWLTQYLFYIKLLKNVLIFIYIVKYKIKLLKVNSFFFLGVTGLEDI